MFIWKVSIGHGTLPTDHWLIRAADFSEAVKKADKTSQKKQKEFVNPMDILRLEIIGEEAA